MTWQELLEHSAEIYRDYNSDIGLEDDVKELMERFLLPHFNDFICVLPTSCFGSSFVIDATLQSFNPTHIDYNGGKIILSNLTEPYLKLITFKHKEWKTKLFFDDLDDENSPARKLQSSKWTSGKISRPYICIEHSGSDKCLCFWGYKNNINDIEEFSYIKRIDNKNDFLKLEDYLLTAYIYYCLYFLFNTQRETEMSQVMLAQMQQLLAIHNITAKLPFDFSGQKSK